jgi:hypothetical protein
MHPTAILRRYIAAGSRHRWRALGVAWMICLVGWAGLYAIPNQWMSSTRVYADADAILGMLLRGIALDNSPAGQVEILQRTLLSGRTWRRSSRGRRLSSRYRVRLIANNFFPFGQGHPDHHADP